MVAVRPVTIGGANRARSAAAPTGVAPSGAIPTQVAPPDTSGAFRVIAQAAENLAGELERNMIRRDQLTAAVSRARFQRNAEEEINQLDPTAPDHDQQVQSVLASLREDALARAELNTDQVQQDLAANLTIFSEGMRGRAAGQRREALAVQAQETLQERLNVFSASVRNDPDAASVYAAQLEQEVAPLLNAIPPEAHDNVQREIDLQTINAMVDGLADEGRYTEARNVIDENPESLDAGQARALRRRIRATRSRRRQEFLRATASQVAELEIQLARANTEEEIQLVERRIEDAREQGLFTGREGSRATLIRRLEGQREQVVREERAYTNTLTNFSRGAGVTSQEEADLLWEGQPDAGRPGLRGDVPVDPTQPLTSDHIDEISQFVGQAGFVPTAVERRMEAAERVNNPDLLAQAATLQQSIRNQIGPEVDTGAGDRVEMTLTTMEVQGVSPRLAAETVLTNSPLDRAQRQQRSELFREEIGQEIDFEQVADEVTTGAGLGGFVGIGDLDADNLSARARSDFTRAYEHFFQQSGDQEVARRQATRVLRENYGTSTASDGRTQFMRHPPERFLGRELDSESRRALMERGGEILQQDIERNLSDLGLPMPTAAAGMPRYNLVADDRTDTELRQGATPSYQLRLNNGLSMVPVRVVRTDGSTEFLRYTPPTSAAELGTIPLVQEMQETRVREAEEERRDRIRTGQQRTRILPLPEEAAAPPATPAPSLTNPFDQDFFPSGEGEEDPGLPPGFFGE